MDTISIIMASLVAGVTAGLTQGTQLIARQALVDAYNSLKSMLISKSEDSPKTEEALTNFEKDPKTGTELLREDLEKNKFDEYSDVSKKSKEILELLIESHPKFKDQKLSNVVGQLNTYGGKIIVVGGNVDKIDM